MAPAMNPRDKCGAPLGGNSAGRAPQVPVRVTPPRLWAAIRRAASGPFGLAVAVLSAVALVLGCGTADPPRAAEAVPAPAAPPSAAPALTARTTCAVDVVRRGHAIGGAAVVGWRPLRFRGWSRSSTWASPVRRDRVAGTLQPTDASGRAVLSVPSGLFPIEICAWSDDGEAVLRRVTTPDEAERGVRLDLHVADWQRVAVVVRDRDGRRQPNSRVRVREYMVGYLLPVIGSDYLAHARQVPPTTEMRTDADGELEYGAAVGSVLVVTAEGSDGSVGSCVWVVPASTEAAPAECSVPLRAGASGIIVRLIGPTPAECAEIARANMVESTDNVLVLPPVPLGDVRLTFPGWTPAEQWLTVGGSGEATVVSLARPFPVEPRIAWSGAADVSATLVAERDLGESRRGWTWQIKLGAGPVPVPHPESDDASQLDFRISENHDGKWPGVRHWVQLGSIGAGGDPLQVPRGASVSVRGGDASDDTALQFSFIEEADGNARYRGDLFRFVGLNHDAAVHLIGNTPAVVRWTRGSSRGSACIANAPGEVVTLDTTASTPWTCKIRVSAHDGSPIAGVLCTEWTSSESFGRTPVSATTGDDGIAALALPDGDAAFVRATVGGVLVAGCVVRRGARQGDVDAEVAVLPVSRLTVRVLSPAGEARPGVVVRCSDAAAIPHDHSEVTGADGTASFLLERGRYRVRVGSERTVTPVTIANPQHELAVTVR